MAHFDLWLTRNHNVHCEVGSYANQFVSCILALILVNLMGLVTLGVLWRIGNIQHTEVIYDSHQIDDS